MELRTVAILIALMGAAYAAPTPPAPALAFPAQPAPRGFQETPVTRVLEREAASLEWMACAWHIEYLEGYVDGLDAAIEIVGKYGDTVDARTWIFIEESEADVCYFHYCYGRDPSQACDVEYYLGVLNGMAEAVRQLNPTLLP